MGLFKKKKQEQEKKSRSTLFKPMKLPPKEAKISLFGDWEEYLEICPNKQLPGLFHTKRMDVMDVNMDTIKLRINSEEKNYRIWSTNYRSLDSKFKLFKNTFFQDSRTTIIFVSIDQNEKLKQHIEEDFKYLENIKFPPQKYIIVNIATEKAKNHPSFTEIQNFLQDKIKELENAEYLIFEPEKMDITTPLVKAISG